MANEPVGEGRGEGLPELTAEVLDRYEGIARERLTMFTRSVHMDAALVLSLVAAAREREQLRAEIERLQAGQGWVSVSARLPGEGERVLVSVQPMDARLSATYREGVWFLPTRLRGQTVTHWMPLPDAPFSREEADDADRK